MAALAATGAAAVRRGASPTDPSAPAFFALGAWALGARVGWALPPGQNQRHDARLTGRARAWARGVPDWAPPPGDADGDPHPWCHWYLVPVAPAAGRAATVSRLAGRLPDDVVAAVLAPLAADVATITGLCRPALALLVAVDLRAVPRALAVAAPALGNTRAAKEQRDAARAAVAARVARGVLDLRATEVPPGAVVDAFPVVLSVPPSGTAVVMTEPYGPRATGDDGDDDEEEAGGDREGAATVPGTKVEVQLPQRGLDVTETALRLPSPRAVATAAFGDGGERDAANSRAAKRARVDVGGGGGRGRGDGRHATRGRRRACATRTARDKMR
jgi:hypothetical protein